MLQRLSIQDQPSDRHGDRWPDIPEPCFRSPYPSVIADVSASDQIIGEVTQEFGHHGADEGGEIEQGDLQVAEEIGRGFDELGYRCVYTDSPHCYQQDEYGSYNYRQRCRSPQPS